MADCCLGKSNYPSVKSLGASVFDLLCLNIDHFFLPRCHIAHSAIFFLYISLLLISPLSFPINHSQACEENRTTVIGLQLSKLCDPARKKS